MNTTQIIIFGGLAAFIIATQVGRHTISLRRFITPILAVIGVSFVYLKGVPTVGGDLPFELICTLVGIAFGLLAASLVRVERDGRSGKLVTQAGVAYATVWAIVFGGRIAFGWAASNAWQRAVGQFSIDHAITGEAAWTAAFVLMAIAMVAARTAVLAARALWVYRGAPALVFSSGL
jgi:hypothetical protein